MKVHLVAAARPNFMKVAPLWHAMSRSSDFEPILIHSGQHYDPEMSGDVMRDLALPTPDLHLGIRGKTHAEQTGGVMIAYEKVALMEPPDWLLVVGDVNTTAACAIVGAKLGLPVVHLEAGLRSFDRSMPEEINRLLTDAVSDVLWTPSPDADENLRREGIAQQKITRVGNIMLDSFEHVRPSIEAVQQRQAFGLEKGAYGVITLHRPSNVDDAARLEAITAELVAIQKLMPIVFPVHPRTAARLKGTRPERWLRECGVKLVPPLSYMRFMSLVTESSLVITDSGGIQEETTYLGIPCLTLRENTERPITISQGTNRLVRVETLVSEATLALSGDPRKAKPLPEFWDGRTAERCIEDLRRRSTAGE